MNSALELYIPGTSFVHRGDARVKLVLLLSVSVTVFLVKTWLGIGIISLVVLALLGGAGIPIKALCKLSLPLLVLLAFIWLCNAVTFSVTDTLSARGFSAGFMNGWTPVALWGDFGFNPQGCMVALMYASRILVVFFASYIVSFTTRTESLTRAFSSLLRPLHRFKVPSDDIAMVLSLAIRFIPLMAMQASKIQKAQISRGASFDVGGPWKRIIAWRVVLVPLIVTMFRRAAMLGQAMESRCYGAGRRTQLNEQRADRLRSEAEIVFMVAFIGLCGLLIVYL